MSATLEAPRPAHPARRLAPVAPPSDNFQTLIDQFIAEERSLAAVDKFARRQPLAEISKKSVYRDLIPLRAPAVGEQYAFTVDLDKCSGCKACVSACHSLNGLDDDEVWRTVGLLKTERQSTPALQQHITTACHHCVEPGCLEGCPVLAYDKDPTTGIVRHLDDQCIGCTYCVMKCPYEVPKYSSRLGIVRKCDMCANRLAVGEAPACVQACPTQAIQITLVKPSEIKTRFRDASAVDPSVNAFLPDSPDPRVTLPTTRFVSRRGLPERALAADQSSPRLDSPHWPLAVMLLLTQGAIGMFLAGAITLALGGPSGTSEIILVAFALFASGLATSVLHLGQPLKAWRGFLGWRRSWLSREIIMFNLVGAAATPLAALALANLANSGRELKTLHWSAAILPTLAWVVAGLGVGAVFSSAMVYIDTKRPAWSGRRVCANFFGSVVLLGSAFAALTLRFGGGSPGARQLFFMVALATQAGLSVWRGREFVAALRDASSPIHLNARAVAERAAWAPRLAVLLFAISTAAAWPGLASPFRIPPGSMIVATLAMIGSELVARHLFFIASAGKRMPGGVTA